MPDSSIVTIRPVDAELANPRYRRWKHVIPLPPDSLIWSVGARNIEKFLVGADAWAQLVSCYTTPNCTVLDIGCGCGRTARGLTANRYVTTYVGFDVVAENISWCRNFIVVEDPRHFTFHHFDLLSREYNPNGRIPVTDFHFPCADQSVDVTFAASVFTHLLEDDARHYLREIARTLAPGGKAILSIHVNAAPGQTWTGTEARIEVDPAAFIAAAEDAGLRVFERVGEVGGQEVLVMSQAALSGRMTPQ